MIFISSYFNDQVLGSLKSIESDPGSDIEKRQRIMSSDSKGDTAFKAKKVKFAMSRGIPA
jgi:hypothetical protein